MLHHLRYLVVRAALLPAVPAFSLVLRADNQTFKVEGTVINAVTGRPIPRALVEWYGQPGLVSVLTRPDGEFSLGGVPQGRMQVSAQKPGYFAGRGGAPQRPTVFVAGPDSGKLSIKLWPEAIIWGRVLGKDGEPLENAMVRVEKPGSSPARMYLRQNSVVTDEDGNFRIAELPPGEYVVALLSGNVSRRILGIRSVQGVEAYPAIVYYPAGSEESSAEPVDMPPLQLQLTPVDSFNPPVHSNWQPPTGNPLILRGLQPGKYQVHATQGMGGYWSYVSSLRCGFTDLLHEELLVPESGQLPPIEVVLRDDLSMLQLRVNAEKNSYGNIAIIPDGYPTGEPVRNMNVMADQTTSASLAPGNYKIFAFADTEDVDPNDPEELSRYEKKAISATLLPGKTTSLVLELIHTGE
jgi:hypothetical protein